MSWRAAHVMGLGAVVFGLWPATIAKADDQQLVEDYLATLGASGYRSETDHRRLRGPNFPQFQFLRRNFPEVPGRCAMPPDAGSEVLERILCQKWASSFRSDYSGPEIFL